MEWRVVLTVGWRAEGGAAAHRRIVVVDGVEGGNGSWRGGQGKNGHFVKSYDSSIEDDIGETQRW